MIIKVGGGLEPLGPVGVYAYELTNDAISLFLKTAISILIILSHNSFRVLFDKIASVYFI